MNLKFLNFPNPSRDHGVRGMEECSTWNKPYSYTAAAACKSEMENEAT